MRIIFGDSRKTSHEKLPICSTVLERKKESRFFINFSAFLRLKRADSMYSMHYTLAFEPKH